MARTLKALLILTTVLSMAAASAAGQMRGFGFGGTMAMGFFPDMTGINAFLSENGLPSMGDYLVGVGGNGRGGIIGGPSFGGIGWGIFGVSEAEGRSAEFVFGGGGLDIGTAVGGDESSVLTIGAVLGGGANIISISGVISEEGEDGGGTGPCGLVIEPPLREFGRAVGFVQPYLSMAAQILPWMGFEFRVGYIIPVVGFDFGDLTGIPAPNLNLSGITVSFGITFGGIGSIEAAPTVEPRVERPREPTEVTLSRGGSFAVGGAEELVIENAIGDIAIESYRPETQTMAESPIVEWEAVLTADPEDIGGLSPETNVEGLTASLITCGEGTADYQLRIPSGIDLRVKNGAGTIRVVGHEAQTIILDNGVGEVTIEGVRAEALYATTGLGHIAMEFVEADKLVADVFIGEIALGLDPNVSATLTARAGLGEVSIDRFSGMVGGVRGLLGETGDVKLGEGEREIDLKVRVGKIDVWIQEP
jgi:hypothetical protein